MSHLTASSNSKGGSECVRAPLAWSTSISALPPTIEESGGRCLFIAFWIVFIRVM